MKAWRESKLGQLGEFRNGVNYNKSSFGAGIKVLGVSNFQDYTKPRYSELEEIDPDGIVSERNILQTGDVVFVRSNGNRELIGRSLFIEHPPERITHSAFTIRLRFTSPLVHPQFFAYYFRTPVIRSALTACGGGTNISNLNQDILSGLNVPVPPLPIQRRIAGILSAYDELIENSQRRIRILESMARALYREWFVHFRFPGHENHPKVPSPLGDIPKGWEVYELARVCDEGRGIQTGPFGSQLHEADYSSAGVPVVMPKDLIGFRIRTDSIARIPEETANRLLRHRMQVGDIVYGRRGDIGRRAFLMPHQTGWFCGTGCLRIRPNHQRINGWYLFHYLGQDDVAGLIAGRAQGVTMPNLNTRVMQSVPVRIPPRTLQDDFARRTLPIAEAIEAVTAQIENLRRTRDLLLPRLLSGQVDLGES